MSALPTVGEQDYRVRASQTTSGSRFDCQLPTRQCVLRTEDYNDQIDITQLPGPVGQLRHASCATRIGKRPTRARLMG